jgi:ketosteroid isomerase-like protein
MLLFAGIAAGAVSLHAQSAPANDDKAIIKAGYDQYNVDFARKDVYAIMAGYAPDVFVFGDSTPREFPTPAWDAIKKDFYVDVFDSFPGPATSSIDELSITVEGSVAYTHYVNDVSLTRKDGSKERAIYRITDVLRKRNGTWLVVLQHISFPIDPATGKADYMSKR